MTGPRSPPGTGRQAARGYAVREAAAGQRRGYNNRRMCMSRTFRAGSGRGTRAGAAGGQAARAGGHDGALGLDAAVLSWWRPPDTCALVLGGDGHAVLPAKPCVNGVVWTRERHHRAETHVQAGVPAKA